MSGKGSTRRPPQIPAAEADANWARTFGQAPRQPAPLAKPDEMTDTVRHDDDGRACG